MVGGGEDVPLRLLLGLELLGTGEKTTAGNASVEEGTVVGAAIELGGRRLDANGFEVVLEEALDLCRAVGAGDVESGPITIVDQVAKVGRSCGTSVTSSRGVRRRSRRRYAYRSCRG